MPIPNLWEAKAGVPTPLGSYLITSNTIQSLSAEFGYFSFGERDEWAEWKDETPNGGPAVELALVGFGHKPMKKKNVHTWLEEYNQAAQGNNQPQYAVANVRQMLACAVQTFPVKLEEIGMVVALGSFATQLKQQDIKFVPYFQVYKDRAELKSVPDDYEWNFEARFLLVDKASLIEHKKEEQFEVQVLGDITIPARTVKELLAAGDYGEVSSSITDEYFPVLDTREKVTVALLRWPVKATFTTQEIENYVKEHLASQGWDLARLEHALALGATQPDIVRGIEQGMIVFGSKSRLNSVPVFGAVRDFSTEPSQPGKLGVGAVKTSNEWEGFRHTALLVRSA